IFSFVSPSPHRPLFASGRFTNGQSLNRNSQRSANIVATAWLSSHPLLSKLRLVFQLRRRPGVFSSWQVAPDQNEKPLTSLTLYLKSLKGTSGVRNNRLESGGEPFLFVLHC